MRAESYKIKSKSSSFFKKAYSELPWSKMIGNRTKKQTDTRLMGLYSRLVKSGLRSTCVPC